MCALMALPPNLYEDILENLSVYTAVPLCALQRDAGQLFEKSYVPHFYVVFTKPIRTGGRLSVGLHAFKSAQATCKF